MRREHLDFFNATLSKIQSSVGISVPVIPYDHSKLAGHANALGACHGTFSNGRKGWNVEKITIDEGFIEDCYDAEFNGKWYLTDLAGDDLIGVICHELAHVRHWRHGKKHKECTHHLISLVEGA